MFRLCFLGAGCALFVAWGCVDDTLLVPTPLGQIIYVEDVNYVQGKYFFLIDPNGMESGRITKVHLYLDNRTPRDDHELGALLSFVWLDPNAKTPAEPVIGYFHQLKEEDDFTLPTEQNLGFDRLELKNPLYQYETLAVAYILQPTDAPPETVGTWFEWGETPPDTLNLKMLRPSDEQWGPNDLRISPWAPVRYLEAKNVYSLGVHDLEPASLTVDVVRDIAGEGGQNPNYIDSEAGRHILLQVLGLDQKNNVDVDNRTPDHRIDPEFVDFANGLIFFPDLRPFDPDLADIEGTSIREQSWPRQEGVERPDTLGWTRLDGIAVPSSQERRNAEVSPEIYDLKYSALSQEHWLHHIYSIAIKIKSTSYPQYPE